MSGLLLTREERERFAAWLEREAESGRMMIEQMVKMKIPDVLIQRERAEAAAAALIACKLRSIEDMTT